MQANKLIGRAKAILLTPRAEWPLIAAEPDTVGGLYTGYILILAALPAVTLLLSSRYFGMAILPIAITTYVLSLAGTFLVALIVDALAPSFGGQKDRVQALKVVAYSYTASWVAALIGVVPGLGLLSALAGLIYGLYLLNLGLPYTMKCPADRAIGYTIVTVIAAIVVSVVLGLVVRAVGGYGTFGRDPLMGALHRDAADTAVIGAGTATGSAVDDYAKRMDAASKQLETAQKSSDPAAKASALGQFMGTALGSGGKVESLAPDQIKTFLPEQLDGLKRTQQAVERNGAIGMQISKASATYSDGANRTLQLEIVDAGSLKGLVGFASSWAGVDQESQTDAGFDKTYRSGGQLVHEQWNNASKSGEYTAFIADRFSVRVSGQANDIGVLKHAAAGIDAGGLAALKDAGVASQ